MIITPRGAAEPALFMPSAWIYVPSGAVRRLARGQEKPNPKPKAGSNFPAIITTKAAALPGSPLISYSAL